LFKDLLVTDEKRYTIMKPRKQLIDAAVANGRAHKLTKRSLSGMQWRLHKREKILKHFAKY
jgi:hypothetical protein